MSRIPPAGKPGFISVQNSDAVTVAFVDPVDKEVRTSTTVETTNGDAVPATEADKIAQVNTRWGVAAASVAMDRLEAEKVAQSDTVYVVDDDYGVEKVGGAGG